MDEIAEIEEYQDKHNLSYNYTFDETDRVFFEGLHPHQIGMCLFSTFCIVPNIFIIYLILRNKLSSTIYWTILNWSILNVVLILNFVPLTIIPFYIVGHIINYIFYVGLTIFTFTGLLVTFLTINVYVESERVCRFLIASVWVLILCFSILIIVLLYSPHSKSIRHTYVSEIFYFIISLSCLIRLALFSYKRPNSQTFSLRIRLCSVFIITMFFFWLSPFMEMLHFFYAIITLICTIVIYVGGFINLGILTYNDPKIKRHCLQLFCGSEVYRDINFDAQNSVVRITHEIEP